jgi:hypothetical protein
MADAFERALADVLTFRLGLRPQLTEESLWLLIAYRI